MSEETRGPFTSVSPEVMLETPALRQQTCWRPLYLPGQKNTEWTQARKWKPWQYENRAAHAVIRVRVP